MNWLTTRLFEQGYVTGDRVGRRVQLRSCRWCGVRTFRGLDADRAALMVVVDPVALNQAGEVWALERGRGTYLLSRDELSPRNRFNIPGKPPSGSRVVLVAHECGVPVPAWGLLDAPPVEPVDPVREVLF